ncbi:MAG: CoA-binding protein [Dehalococcoidia bacterium]|nr:CoA-binding protein [Dehalococcoidia bacterium]
MRWWINEYYIEPLLRMGYQGKIYAINPRGGEILGMPVYRSLRDIPGPVDHVVSCIPAEETPHLLEECRDVGARVLQLFTAGFAETGEPDRIELQRKLVEMARRSNIRVLGPNCMGIYCPKSRISFCLNYPQEAGPIGLISQSGSNTSYIIRSAVVRGLRFSKAISYGNACDIDECDLLDYLADDDETKVIAAYIEGTSDGQRLRRVLTRAASIKPVVIYKGGYTEGGTRAASSHTGALAGADTVWDGFLKQVGVIKVHTVGELVDMLVALLRMKPPGGLNTCAVGNGGGASLLATDELERAGLRLPPIPPHIRERLKELIPLAGSMIRNPFDASPLLGAEQARLLDTAGMSGWEDALRETRFLRGDKGIGDFMAALDDWPELDSLILHYSIDSLPGTIRDWALATGAGPMIVAAKECHLPVAAVVHFIANEDSWLPSLKTQKLCIEAGFPLFLSVRGAARAIRRLIEFNKLHPELLRTLREEMASEPEVKDDYGQIKPIRV